MSEKFFDLCRLFGAERVGMMTGDASINRDAPIVCCTAEILANMALRDGDDAARRTSSWTSSTTTPIASAAMAWQVPLLALDATTFLLMSATLGDMRVITEGLHARRPGARSRSCAGGSGRCRCEFEYRETPLHETIDELVEERARADLPGQLHAAGRAPTRRRT